MAWQCRLRGTRFCAPKGSAGWTPIFLTKVCQNVTRPLAPVRPSAFKSRRICDDLGVVLWEVLTRRQPFEGLTPIQAAFAVARQGLRPQLPRSAPVALAALIRDCWHATPEDRPSFVQVRSRHTCEVPTAGVLLFANMSLLRCAMWKTTFETTTNFVRLSIRERLSYSCPWRSDARDKSTCMG